MKATDAPSPDDLHDLHDLLVVGAGPTGIAIGAEAKKAGLDALLVDRGPLCAAIFKFPSNMTFFTTRDLLEIAGIPLSIPEDKPTRRHALTYYQGVAHQHDLRLALFEDVLEVRRSAEGFAIGTRSTRTGEERVHRARAVALAMGYFDQPKVLGVPGEDKPWVRNRYDEPYAHFGQHVVVVGGGNSGCETALELWRNNVRVTLIHRRARVKPTVKYWVKPDIENRIAEGSIEGLFESAVEEFRGDGEVVVRTRRADADDLVQTIHADAVYVLVGYTPDADFERRCGVEVDAASLVPVFDPETCESNVPGLYIAGTLQAGRNTGKIFIENSRQHAPKIVRHLLAQRPVAAAV